MDDVQSGFRKERSIQDHIFTIKYHIDLEELLSAAQKIKTGRAPGPDHLTPNAVKALVSVAPDELLAVFNQLIRAQKFPEK